MSKGEMVDIRVKELQKKCDQTDAIVQDALKKFDHNVEKTLPALYNKYKIDVDFCMKELVRHTEEQKH